MERIFDAQYLSERQMKGFDNYKYSSIDTSPLSNYISHPFWDWLVKFYPLWLPPNVLTLAGFLLVMLGFFIISYLDYDLDVNTYYPSPMSIPNWIWLFLSILTFMAHTLDGTDGKQARRTGSSGPTGELFDHGLDSWSTVPFTITIFSVFGQGEFSVSLVRLLYILISVQVVFIVTHWEKYNTGILFLSWGYDASQFSLVGFYLLTYYVGYQSFKFYVFDSVTFAQCFEAGFYVICIFSLLVSVYNIYVSYFVDKTGLQSNVYEACLPMFPALMLFAASICWAKYSPNDIINLETRIFFWTMGTAFSNIACHLIVAQMTHTRAPSFNFLLSLYCGAVLIAVFGNIDVSLEARLLQVLAAVITLAHLHYGICLVRQLCNHFKIEAFSLRYLQKRDRHE